MKPFGKDATANRLAFRLREVGFDRKPWYGREPDGRIGWWIVTHAVGVVGLRTTWLGQTEADVNRGLNDGTLARELARLGAT